jgi:hypothetical protein
MKKSRSRAHFDFDNVVIPINFMPVSPAPSPLAPPKDIHTPKWSIVSDYDSYFTEGTVLLACDGIAHSSKQITREKKVPMELIV